MRGGILYNIARVKTIVVVLFLCFTAYSTENNIELKPHFWAIPQFGQIVKGKYKGENLLENRWLHNTLINFTFNAKINERMQAIASMEASTWYNTFPSDKISDIYQVPTQNFAFYIHHAEGIYSLGDLDNPWRLAIGLVPYKYNPHARNLGEYLFRTGTYPSFIFAEFEYAFVRITGIRLMKTFFKSWENELILTQRTEMQPFHDLNLTALSLYKFQDLFELGGGIQLAHLISMEENKTTPKTDLNMYIDTTIVFSGAVPVDTLADTSYYTYKGTKLMARAALDPKALINADVFGKNDLRIYFEAALLGWKNYPGYYENRMERLPVMAGFNIPTFKFLEVLAMEVEWYGSKYPNNHVHSIAAPHLWSSGAVPGSPQLDYMDYDWKKDDWKWSLYAKKIFTPGFMVSALAGRDHMRTRSQFAHQADYEEALTRPGHWYWMVRFTFGL
jgi:hypothetical protein